MQFEIFCGSAAITSSLNSQMNDAELTSIAAEVGALLTNFKWRSGLTGGLLLRRVLCPGKSKDRGPDLGSTWVRGKVLLDRK